MRRAVVQAALLCVVVGLLVLTVGNSPGAAGPCADNVSSDDEAFWTEFECDTAGGAGGGNENGPGSHYDPPTMAEIAAVGACLGRIDHCVAEPAPAAVLNDLLVSALRRVRPPDAQLVVQPPGGKTLVSFDTIFSTKAEPFTRTVRLLGHEVVLKIRASSFSWRFGDDTTPLVTAKPGRTYERGLPMDSYITHRYTDAGVTVHPRVDTTYSAEYSVDGGPFQPVIGTVTIEGEPASLRVVEARPVLTGGR